MTGSFTKQLMLSVLCCGTGRSPRCRGRGSGACPTPGSPGTRGSTSRRSPRPSSNTSSVSSCAGIEKCCIKPGRSQKRMSTISTSSSGQHLEDVTGSRHDSPPFVRERLRDRMPVRTTKARYDGPRRSCPRTGPLSSAWRVVGYAERAAARLGDQPGHDVRVHVGVRTPVLDVALLVDLDLPRDAHRRTTVGHAVAELVPRRGLVLAGEPVLDAGAVRRPRAPRPCVPSASHAAMIGS